LGSAHYSGKGMQIPAEARRRKARANEGGTT
jgi:hypothetical protein